MDMSSRKWRQNRASVGKIQARHGCGQIVEKRRGGDNDFGVVCRQDWMSMAEDSNQIIRGKMDAYPCGWQNHAGRSP